MSQPNVEHVVPGAAIRTQRVNVQISSAQLLALNATPIQLVAAPGAGFALILVGMLIQKPAGVAYAGIAAGEDLSVKYTDGSGAEVGRAAAVEPLTEYNCGKSYIWLSAVVRS